MSAITAHELARIRALVESGAAKSIRVSADVTTGEVARDAELDPSTIWRYENGHRRPRGDAARRYLRVLEEISAR